LRIADAAAPHSWRRRSRDLMVESRLRTMAVTEGFEPSVACTTHAFQACSFGRSDTSPGNNLTILSDSRTTTRPRAHACEVNGRALRARRGWFSTSHRVEQGDCR